MSDLRDRFEEKVKNSKTSLANIITKCKFDENCNDYGSDVLHDYSIGVLNGAWWMFQELNK
jgi:putative component of membrane protein insertase Oxa1/YidC/SpoIIIJ protein YidD